MEGVRRGDAGSASNHRDVIIDGYVRVSQVAGRSGESFISPSVQRERIVSWARVNGALIGEIFEELDESGGRADRPLLLKALARIECGESQGLVVAKLDRFGRSLVDALSAIERIRAAGGTFVSVADGFDLSTETGKFVLRTMLSVAELELDRVRANWRVATERAVRRGIYVGSIAPTGYERDARTRRLRPHPTLGAVVGEVFDRRAAGVSYANLARNLEASGIRTARGYTTWTADQLRAMVKNRVYLGELRRGDFINLAAHPPLTDPVTWQRAQRLRYRVPVDRHEPSLLGGLIRCAGCRMVMATGWATDKSGRRVRNYHCLTVRAAGRCEAPAHIRGSVVEPYVEQVFWRLAARRSRPTADDAAATRKLARAELALTTYRDNDAAQLALGPQGYAEGLRTRAHKVELALLQLGALRDRAATAHVRSADELRAAWPAMDVVARRAAIRDLVDCAFVYRGCARDRIFVCAAGDGPADLPDSVPGRPLRAFDPSQCLGSQPNAATVNGRRPRWKPSRIRVELEAFLDNGRELPSGDTFRAAGKGELFEQILAGGGTLHWAAVVGVRTPPGRMSVDEWSEERIRSVLAVFLRDRRTWPTHDEFLAAGYGGMHSAIHRRGGPEHYADDYGVILRYRSKALTSYWTDERIRRMLGDFTNGRDLYPTFRDFQDAELIPLETAIRKTRGHHWWADQFGLRRQGPACSRPAPGQRRGRNEFSSDEARQIRTWIGHARKPQAIHAPDIPRQRLRQLGFYLSDWGSTNHNPLSVQTFDELARDGAIRVVG